MHSALSTLCLDSIPSSLTSTTNTHSFSASFLSLPEEVQEQILVLLSPHDLGVLSRCVGAFEGVHKDQYLRKVWHTEVSNQSVRVPHIRLRHPACLGMC